MPIDFWQMVTLAAGGLLGYLGHGYIDMYFELRRDRRRYTSALRAFLENSRTSEYIWTSEDLHNPLRRDVQILHLVPIYKDFHHVLRTSPPLEVMGFNGLSEREMKSKAIREMTLRQAEIQTVFHVVKFLSDNGAVDEKHIVPTDYLFRATEQPFDLPARYWQHWLKKACWSRLRGKPKG